MKSFCQSAAKKSHRPKMPDVWLRGVGSVGTAASMRRGVCNEFAPICRAVGNTLKEPVRVRRAGFTK